MANKSKLGLFDFTIIVVTLVIGMGIFKTPASVAANSNNPIMFFAVWIAGGCIALCGALTYAEIGSRLPVAGGYYQIFSYAYHPSIAFAVNCIILISNAASLAGVALIGAEYIIKVLLPNETNVEIFQIAIAIFSILFFYGINLLGLKMSATTQNILGIGLILLLILPLFFYTASPTITTIPVLSANSIPLMEYIKAFGIGLVAVSFTYGGYQQTINFGGEVANPTKNIPRGIMLGIVIILVLYLSINYAYYKVIGFEQLKNASGIATIMASHVFGSAASNILSVLLFLSVLAYVNVLLMSNPRVMQAMSKDGVLPSAFGNRSKKNDVLFTSLSVFTALCTIIVFWAKTFDEILSFSIFLDCFGMALSAAAIFVVRKKTKHLNNTGIYSMKLFPLFPVIFIAAYVFVATSIFIDKPTTALLGLAILTAFILLFFLLKSRGK
jgi:basic amino acid/polyamine antiporter, APA family